MPDMRGYYMFGIPTFLALVLLESVLSRRKLYGFATTIGNLSGGLGKIVFGAFLGPIMFQVYTAAYTHLALVHWPLKLQWIVALFAADFCYYCQHLFGHRVSLAWAVHGVHHQAEDFNLSVAMRHPWLSDFYLPLFFLPLPLLGFEPAPFFAAVSFVSLYSLAIHSPHFTPPSLFIFVTARAHVLHHSKDRRYLGKNLGAVFTLWDRMFGTYVQAEEPVQIGGTRPYETHDNLRAQLVPFRDLALSLKQTESWKDRARTLFGKPGWRAQGVQLPTRTRARDDDALPTLGKVYVVLQLLLLGAFAMYVFAQPATFSFAARLLVAAQALVGLTALGGLLDGRKNAARFEAVRAALMAAHAGLLLL